MLLESRRILDRRIRGSQRCSLFEGRSGLIVLSHLVKTEAQIIVGFGQVWVSLEGFLEPIGRDIYVSQLVLADTLVIVRPTGRTGYWVCRVTASCSEGSGSSISAASSNRGDALAATAIEV